MVNICTVHYNTPELLEALICSIEFQVKSEYQIYIFDNSDKEPFVNNGHKHITIFDNTNGQIIDFDRWLGTFRNKSKIVEQQNNFGSAKHAYSIEKLIEQMDDGFVLLDSDVLLKKDISGIVDDRYYAVGEVYKRISWQTKRILPYVCYINVKKCKENNIHYFDPNRIVGLFKCKPYDTGTSFFEDVSKVGEIKPISISEYVEHFKRGSWLNKKDDALAWISKHKNLFTKTEKTQTRTKAKRNIQRLRNK